MPEAAVETCYTIPTDSLGGTQQNWQLTTALPISSGSFEPSGRWYAAVMTSTMEIPPKLRGQTFTPLTALYIT